MDEWREQAFHGGRQTVGITRIGDTVRRPRHARSDLVHAVLRPSRPRASMAPRACWHR